MAKTVYVLGAGINRALSARDFGYGPPEPCYPPLATDLFQQAFKNPKYTGERFTEYWQRKLEPLLSFIEEHWGRSIISLRQDPFDLEECYTKIQLQITETKRESDTASHDSEKRDVQRRLRLLYKIEHTLTAFLSDYLAEFSPISHFQNPSRVFESFANIVYSTRATILTFNYDLLLEEGIRAAFSRDFTEYAQSREDTDSEQEIEAAFLRSPNTALHTYSVEFDWVKPPFPQEGLVPYEKNDLGRVPFLKLHGSLNWFEYTAIPDIDVSAYEGERAVLQSIKKGQVVRDNSSYRGKDIGERDYSQPHFPEDGGDPLFLRPLIVTPVLHKDIDSRPAIKKLWQSAHQELTGCERLVVGGYSFPPTDLHTRKLFQEAFAEHSPEEIVVINPDTCVVRIVKDLCQFKKPVLVCSNLEEYNALHPELVLPPYSEFNLKEYLEDTDTDSSTDG